MFAKGTISSEETGVQIGESTATERYAFTKISMRKITLSVHAQSTSK